MLLIKAMLSLKFYPVCNIIFGNTNACSVSTFKNKINNITQPLNHEECSVQCTKVICFFKVNSSFYLWCYYFKWQNHHFWSTQNVVTRKEFRFKMVIFYSEVNKLGITLGKGLFEQFLEAIIRTYWIFMKIMDPVHYWQTFIFNFIWKFRTCIAF